MVHQGADTTSPERIRVILRSIFEYSLQVADVQHAMERNVSWESGVLRVGPELYDLRRFERVFVVSIGKAARTMADCLAATVRSGILEGIVVAPLEVSPQLSAFRYFHGGHPLPTDKSLQAGEAVLHALHTQTEKCLVIYMISGGASAICEWPISDQITLEDVIQTYRVLVHSGAPIAEINAIRKHLSALKGGRMAKAAGAAKQVAVLVSDVPEGKLDSLASGPTMPDSTTVQECYDVAQRYGMVPQFPPSVKKFFETASLEETPKAGDPAFLNVRSCLISSNSTALRAAAARASEMGFEIVEDNSCDDWDYAAAADYLLTRLCELRRSREGRVGIISGGEVTVKVVNGGAGGRNQQFALYCAERIAGNNIAVLSAGTDGIDGNSLAAGAIVDGTTMARAHKAKLEPSEALAKFDAFPLFEKIGDAIITGPTGNNVRDLRVLLAW